MWFKALGIDGMTADYYKFKNKDLSEISTRIVNETKGVNVLLRYYI